MGWEPDPKLLAVRLQRMLCKRRHFIRKQRRLQLAELRFRARAKNED